MQAQNDLENLERKLEWAEKSISNAENRRYKVKLGQLIHGVLQTSVANLLAEDRGEDEAQAAGGDFAEHFNDLIIADMREAMRCANRALRQVRQLTDELWLAQAYFEGRDDFNDLKWRAETMRGRIEFFIFNSPNKGFWSANEEEEEEMVCMLNEWRS